MAQTIKLFVDIVGAIDVLLSLKHATGTVINRELIQNFYDKFKEPINKIPYIENDNKTITFSEESITLLENLFAQYLQDSPETVDVVWMPVISSDKVSANFFSTVSGYYKFRSWTDNEALSIISGNLIKTDDKNDSIVQNVNGSEMYYKQIVTVQPVGDFIFIHDAFKAWSTVVPQAEYWASAWGNVSSSAGSINALHLYRSDGISVSKEDCSFHAMTLGENDTYTISSVSDIYVCNQYNWIYPWNPSLLHPYGTGGIKSAIVVRGCNTNAPIYVPLFKNVNAYKSWITGQAGYYRFNSGYSGGDITINPNLDYSRITTEIQDAMRQAFENDNSFEAMLSQMQAAFSKALAEISGTLDEIGGNTTASNLWLEKIYQKLSELYDQIVPSYRGEE